MHQHRRPRHLVKREGILQSAIPAQCQQYIGDDRQRISFCAFDAVVLPFAAARLGLVEIDDVGIIIGHALDSRCFQQVLQPRPLLLREMHDRPETSRAQRADEVGCLASATSR